jgi:glucokinase
MYLGIEIGGTKLQLGVGAGDGKLAGLWRGAVDVAAGPEGIRRQISATVPELLTRSGVDRTRIAGIGIGFGGPVDDATRRIIKSHQIEGWDDFPLADWISDMLGWPAVLGNDADVAGLAEALFGAGKGLSPIFYITIGSGIGGGLIINGEIYRGCGRGAAEIGHLRVPVSCVRESEFGYQPLELQASGWSIAQRARKKLLDPSVRDRAKKMLDLAGGNPDRLTGQLVGEAAALGDEVARSLMEETCTYLAEAICHVIALLCPRRIVVGGGVSLLGDMLLFEPLRAKVAERVFRAFADCYKIVPAALGEEVVVHGALALACRQLASHLHPGQLTR